MGIIKTEQELESAAQVIRYETKVEGNTRLRIYDLLSNLITTVFNGVAPESNLDGVGAPTINDDSTQGYSKGSFWIDTTSNPKEAYRCLSANVGAANWVETTLSVDELSAVAIGGKFADLLEAPVWDNAGKKLSFATASGAIVLDAASFFLGVGNLVGNMRASLGLSSMNGRLLLADSLDVVRVYLNADPAIKNYINNGKPFGIGTNVPNDHAVLDLVSSNKGWRPPQLTQGEIDTLTLSLGASELGLEVENLTTGNRQKWMATEWEIDKYVIQQTLNFVDMVAYSYTQGQAYRIDSITAEAGVTPSIKLGGTATDYVLGDTVAAFDKLDISVDVIGAITIKGTLI